LISIPLRSKVNNLQREKSLTAQGQNRKKPKPRQYSESGRASEELQTADVISLRNCGETLRACGYEKSPKEKRSQAQPTH